MSAHDLGKIGRARRAGRLFGSDQLGERDVRKRRHHFRPRLARYQVAMLPHPNGARRLAGDSRNTGGAALAIDDVRCCVRHGDHVTIGNAWPQYRNYAS